MRFDGLTRTDARAIILILDGRKRSLPASRSKKIGGLKTLVPMLAMTNRDFRGFVVNGGRTRGQVVPSGSDFVGVAEVS